MAKKKRFQITVMESEKGWGQERWTETFDTYADAADRIEEINSKNTATTAPDYYMQAYIEIKEV